MAEDPDTIGGTKHLNDTNAHEDTDAHEDAHADEDEEEEQEHPFPSLHSRLFIPRLVPEGKPLMVIPWQEHK
jgi:hypothetical protein